MYSSQLLDGKVTVLFYPLQMKNLSSGAADDEGHILVSGNILKIDCISLDWESGNIYLVS